MNDVTVHKNCTNECFTVNDIFHDCEATRDNS